MAEHAVGGLPRRVPWDVRDHHVRLRRGGDLARRAPGVGADRDGVPRRWGLVAHHPRVGDGGDVRHLRRRRGQWRSPQPGGHVVVRATSGLCLVEGARLHSGAVARRLRRRRPRVRPVLRGHRGLRTLQWDRASRGCEHRHLRHRAGRLLHELLGSVSDRSRGHRLPRRVHLRGERSHEHPATSQPRPARHRLRRLRHRLLARCRHRLRHQPGPGSRPRFFAWVARWGDAALPGTSANLGAYWWVPILGPIVGAIFGALVYDLAIHNVLAARGTAETPHARTVGEVVLEEE